MLLDKSSEIDGKMQDFAVVAQIYEFHECCDGHKKNYSPINNECTKQLTGVQRLSLYSSSVMYRCLLQFCLNKTGNIYSTAANYY